MVPVLMNAVSQNDVVRETRRLNERGALGLVENRAIALSLATCTVQIVDGPRTKVTQAGIGVAGSAGGGGRSKLGPWSCTEGVGRSRFLQFFMCFVEEGCKLLNVGVVRV